MNTQRIKSPEPSEFASYYSIYTDLVEGDDVLAALNAQIPVTRELLVGIPEENGSFRYEDGKWSIKELVGHLIDTERIMAYRALRFARGDKTDIEGFDQDPYVENGNFNACSITDLAAHFELLRRANLHMFQGLSEKAWSRSGIASGNPVSVRALAYIIAGHEIHHLNILKERYLAQ
ncbi:MAG: DinB family protein [Pyrinomonadaceae bacterium]|nr:DinB family protein [Pyrinomonadaceae bacterium]